MNTATRERPIRRIMRRLPGIWLVAYDNPRSRSGKVGAWTCYAVRIRCSDGHWYHNYNTRYFAWALECWKNECADKFAL